MTIYTTLEPFLDQRSFSFLSNMQFKFVCELPTLCMLCVYNSCNMELGIMHIEVCAMYIHHSVSELDIKIVSQVDAVYLLTLLDVAYTCSIPALLIINDIFAVKI